MVAVERLSPSRLHSNASRVVLQGPSEAAEAAGRGWSGRPARGHDAGILLLLAQPRQPLVVGATRPRVSCFGWPGQRLLLSGSRSDRMRLFQQANAECQSIATKRTRSFRAPCCCSGRVVLQGPSSSAHGGSPLKRARGVGGGDRIPGLKPWPTTRPRCIGARLQRRPIARPDPSGTVHGPNALTANRIDTPRSGGYILRLARRDTGLGSPKWK